MGTVPATGMRIIADGWSCIWYFELGLLRQSFEDLLIGCHGTVPLRFVNRSHS
jgi:hypothetical protein